MIIRDLRGIESTQDACAKIRVSITEMEQFFLICSAFRHENNRVAEEKYNWEHISAIIFL